MDWTDIALLTILIFGAALLYSSVGHAGASGYLAAMALVGVSPDIMKPTALSLNILVASIATIQFARAGHFSWQLFWPFVVGSIPAAYLGGATQLPGGYYRPLVGVVLLFAALRLLLRAPSTPTDPKTPHVAIRLMVGAALGLLSGLTGVGGGIFLSPLLLLAGWADVKRTSSVSAAFIFLNSVAGLLGLLSHSATFPTAIPLWAIAAVVGGAIGSYYGSQRIQSPMLRRLLALVLVVASIKFIRS